MSPINILALVLLAVTLLYAVLPAGRGDWRPWAIVISIIVAASLAGMGV